ncbi:Ig-like domain-containing protein [Mycolicibacterium thermoresistibile]
MNPTGADAAHRRRDGAPLLTRRRALGALALGITAPTVLAACGGDDGSSSREDAAAPPTLTFQPATDAVDVVPTAPVHVDVADGWFQRITLTNPDGKTVAGVLNRDRTAFTVTEPLGYGRTYTWAGSVVGRDGQAVPVAGSFATVDPAVQVSGRFQLADGQVVGVAAPIIIQFDAPISDKAAVERVLQVTTEPPVEGSWAWLPDEAAGSRAHWRPREYYPAGTRVHVDAPLYGVAFGAGAYGAADATLDFSIGRYQVVRAAAPSHRLQVLTDAGVVMDFACSYGEGNLPRNITRSGIHVVTEKHTDFYMTNPAAGYANVHMRHAVRISNNGEFIHANPGSIGAQGNSNVTNGCINLAPADAEQYFHSASYGDPVEVTGTSIPLSAADGDIWDWTVDWDDWLAMSAIPADTPSPGLQVPSPRPGG